MYVSASGLFFVPYWFSPFLYSLVQPSKAINFMENFCHHSKGRNDLLKLELWQKAMVSVIFGIQDEEKIRIFREIFIVIGRKNGKSLFAAAIIADMDVQKRQ